MLTTSYRDLFAAIAEIAATLTGLLFVAISLAPRRDPNTHDGVVQQVRAAAAFLAFVNALLVSLFSLVPGTNVGYPATSLGVVGLFFTAAAVRSILAQRTTWQKWKRQLGLVTVLFLVFGFELHAGISLLANRRNTDAVTEASEVLILSLLVGVARAWELVGHRQTSLFSSIAVLSGHEQHAPVSGDDDERDGSGPAS